MNKRVTLIVDELSDNEGWYLTLWPLLLILINFSPVETLWHDSLIPTS